MKPPLSTLEQILLIVGDTPEARKDIEQDLRDIEWWKTQWGFHRLAQKRRHRDALTRIERCVTQIRIDAASLPQEVAPFFTVLSPALEIMRQMCALSLAEDTDQTPRRDSFNKELAALVALQLMRKHVKPVSTTKHGAFCQLAALLFGDPTADLQYQCRAALAKNRGNYPRDLR